MNQKLVLSLILIVLMGAINAQDTIKIRTGDSQIAEQRYNEGVKLLQNGDVQNAISKFTDAIQLKPDLAKAYYNRGVAKSQVGLFDEAITDLNQALKYEANALYYYTRGKVKQDKGDLDGALQDYNFAININKDLPEAYYYRASLYFDKGEYTNAIDDLKQAISKKIIMLMHIMILAVAI